MQIKAIVVIRRLTRLSLHEDVCVRERHSQAGIAVMSGCCQKVCGQLAALLNARGPIRCQHPAPTSQRLHSVIGHVCTAWPDVIISQRIISCVRVTMLTAGTS